MSRRYSKLTLFVLIMLGFLAIVGAGEVYAVGVRPLVIEMNLRPGDEQDFVIDLLPDTMEELIELVLYEPVQQLNGGLMYQLPVNQGFSATSWVTFEDNLVRVIPGQETSIRGKVRVPFSASGSHTVIVMVESRPPDDPSGFTFRVRYAVRLRIVVERAGIRPTGELNSVEVKPDERGAPRIAARFQNTSALDYLVSGEATIRDQDRRLVERITLRTPAGSAAGSDTTRVYPGAEVEFIGTITRPLPPGAYWIQTFLRYGESGQILRNETFEVQTGEYVFPGFGGSEAMAVNPQVVEHQLRAGERKSQIFEFDSMVGESVRVEIALSEIMPDYEYSLTDWVELRSQPEFILPARAKTRLAMTIAVPRDSADGSYHGKAIFKAYSDISNELFSETIVPINVLVGTEHHRDVFIRSLTTQTTEEGTYLSLDVMNSGNVVLMPQVSAVVYDKENGAFVERVTFELTDERGILPQQTQHMMALATMLETGTYEVEVEVAQSGVEILKQTHEVVVTD